MKKYKIKIQHDACIGCGVCTSMSSGILKMNINTGLVDIDGFEKENGILFGEVTEDQLSEIEKAAAACPQMLIKIEE